MTKKRRLNVYKLNKEKNYSLPPTHLELNSRRGMRCHVPAGIEFQLSSAVESGGAFRTFKGGKYVLLKREADLNDEQKEKLLDMKNASPQIEVMHQLKEEFTEIFDNSKNLGEGTLNLVNWLLKANLYFPKTVRTIINWFGEIVGYFEKRTTNTVVEGINNRLKVRNAPPHSCRLLKSAGSGVLKRCGFGFRNVNNFKNRALLFWHLTNSLA